MIKTITNLKITTSHNLFDQNDTIEYLTIDYLDEDGNQKQIKNLPHEEDAGIYDVKTDSWEDILEDWRSQNPPTYHPQTKAGNCSKAISNTSPTPNLKNWRTARTNCTKRTRWRIFCATSAVSATSAKPLSRKC